MKLTHVTITAGRTFNHPYERYANFRFDITLKGDLEDTINIGPQIDGMREAAETIAEMHKRQILDELETERSRQDLQRSIRNLECLDLDQVKAKIEDAKATNSPDWVIREYQNEAAAIENLPKLREKLAASPKPRLIPELEIHPGHPDHPETDYNGL